MLYLRDFGNEREVPLPAWKRTREGFQEEVTMPEDYHLVALMKEGLINGMRCWCWKCWKVLTLPHSGPKTPQSTLPGGWLTQLRAVVTLDFLKWGKCLPVSFFFFV